MSRRTKKDLLTTVPQTDPEPVLLERHTILKCTYKCLCHELSVSRTQLRELLEEYGYYSKETLLQEYPSEYATIHNLELNIAKILRMIGTRKPVTPPDQTDIVLPGNEVELLIDGEKVGPFFVDEFVTGTSGTKILSLQSPVGKAIMGKPVDFQCTFNGNRHVAIVSIGPYSRAKKIFKPQEYQQAAK